MVNEQRQQAAFTDTLVWLEDEQREAKAQIGRLRQDFDRGSEQTGELTVQVHSALDDVRAVANRLDNLPPFGQQIAELRDQVAEFEEKAGAGERRLTEALRLQAVDQERLRQEVNGVYRRIELLERTAEQSGSRFERLEETDHHTQDAVALIRQRCEELERHQETVDTRAGRNVESFRRLEHDFADLAGTIEGLQKQDLLLSERSQVHGEVVRRLEERVDSLAADLSAQAEIFEKLDLLQAELHRIEDRLALVDRTDDELQHRLDEHHHALGLLDGKGRGFSERLHGLQDELASYRAQIEVQFERLHQALDRQKRRQIEDLERDLRELKTTAFRPPDESHEGG